MLTTQRLFFGLLGAAGLYGGATAYIAVQQSTPALAQTNTINLGAVTTAGPTYVTGTNRPLSLTTGGLLRVDSSGGGASTVAAAGTTAFDAAAAAVNPLLGGCYSSAAAPTDVSADNDATRDWCLRNGARAVQQTFAGVLSATGNGVTGTGSQRVTIASDNTAFSVNVGTFPDNEPVNVAQMNGVAVTMGNGVAGTGVQRVTIASDSTGTVAIGTFPDNEPFNIAQINGVTPLMGAGNTGTGSPRVTIASDQAVIPVSVGAATTGGCTPAKTLSAATTNSTSVKGSAGTLCGVTIINTTATVYYFKLYDKATAATCNSDTVLQTIPIPASTTGAGVVVQYNFGLAFTLGITFCLTGGIADNDNANAATGVAMNYSYK